MLSGIIKEERREVSFKMNYQRVVQGVSKVN
jgi:hypothetical protein